MTNDPAVPKSKLQISGNVEKFANITPRVVRFKGNPTDEMKSSVKIIPEKKHPFSITSVTAKNGKQIKYNLKELKNSDESNEKGYILTIENLKKDSGSYFDVITLNTDNKIQPEIKINVMARLIDPKAPGKKTAPNANKNNFLELIQKMQKEKASGTQNSLAPAQKNDPARSEELKKKFKELIKQAQKKNKLKQQEKKAE